MTADYDRAAVLAQVAKRQADSEALVAEMGIDMSPEGLRASQSALLRERLGEQVARRAEERGQLDLGGGGGDL